MEPEVSLPCLQEPALVSTLSRANAVYCTLCVYNTRVTIKMLLTLLFSKLLLQLRFIKRTIPFIRRFSQNYEKLLFASSCLSVRPSVRLRKTPAPTGFP